MLPNPAIRPTSLRSFRSRDLAVEPALDVIPCYDRELRFSATLCAACRVYNLKCVFVA